MTWLHVLNSNKIPAVENSPSTNIPVNKSLVLFLSCCWQKRNNNSNNKKHNTKQSQPSNQANNHSRNQSIGTYPWCSWISKSIYNIWFVSAIPYNNNSHSSNSITHTSRCLGIYNNIYNSSNNGLNKHIITK